MSYCIFLVSLEHPQFSGIAELWLKTVKYKPTFEILSAPLIPIVQFINLKFCIQASVDDYIPNCSLFQASTFGSIQEDRLKVEQFHFLWNSTAICGTAPV